jgi:hypothetical protein
MTRHTRRTRCTYTQCSTTGAQREPERVAKDTFCKYQEPVGELSLISTQLFSSMLQDVCSSPISCLFYASQRLGLCTHPFSVGLYRWAAFHLTIPQASSTSHRLLRPLNVRWRQHSISTQWILSTMLVTWTKINFIVGYPMGVRGRCREFPLPS